MPGDVRTEVHLTRTDTGGAFCLLADEPPAGWVLPPHRHAREAETIHVVAGTFEVVIAGERHGLRPGDTAHVPAGTEHTSANVGEERGRRVVIFSPAGIEGFFLEAGSPSRGSEHDLGALLAAAHRYGWEFVRG